MDFGNLAIIALALSAGALAKGATGMGLPLIAIPVVASFLGLQHAIGVLQVPILVTNAWQCWRLREEAKSSRVRFLWALLGGSVFGTIVGTWILTSTPDRILTLSLGVLLLAYFAFRLMRPEVVISESTGRKTALPVGFGAGVLQGSTGISAPIGVTFIHAMRLDRHAHVFAVSAMFLMITVVQIPALFVAGIMQPEWLLEGALALIPVAVFMPVGQWLAGKLSKAAFDRLILFFLGVMGAKLALGI